MAGGPRVLASCLVFLASAACFWAASGDAWAVTHIKPPLAFGKDAKPELTTIGLEGVELGSSSYDFHGHLCSKLAECVELRDAGDRTHATLIASAIAFLVGGFVYELGRSSPSVIAFLRSSPSYRSISLCYELHARYVSRLRLATVALTIVLATVASTVAATQFAQTGVRTAQALEAKSANPLGALQSLGGLDALLGGDHHPSTSGAPSDKGGAGAGAGGQPWKDWASIDWTKLIPSDSSKSAPPGAPKPSSATLPLLASKPLVSAQAAQPLTAAAAAAPPVATGSLKLADPSPATDPLPTAALLPAASSGAGTGARAQPAAHAQRAARSQQQLTASALRSAQPKAGPSEWEGALRQGGPSPVQGPSGEPSSIGHFLLDERAVADAPTGALVPPAAASAQAAPARAAAAAPAPAAGINAAQARQVEPTSTTALSRVSLHPNAASTAASSDPRTGKDVPPAWVQAALDSLKRKLTDPSSSSAGGPSSAGERAPSGADGGLPFPIPIPDGISIPGMSGRGLSISPTEGASQRPKVRPGRHSIALGVGLLCGVGAAILIITDLVRACLDRNEVVLASYWSEPDVHSAFLSRAVRV
jgi:hypothetical protein